MVHRTISFACRRTAPHPFDKLRVRMYGNPHAELVEA
jgi:hypothetical protein